MNVTALLNPNNATSGQQKAPEVLRRTRTPWNAGGYSLPMNGLPLSPIASPLSPSISAVALRNEALSLNRLPLSPTTSPTSTRPSDNSFDDRTASLRTTFGVHSPIDDNSNALRQSINAIDDSNVSRVSTSSVHQFSLSLRTGDAAPPTTNPQESLSAYDIPVYRKGAHTRWSDDSLMNRQPLGHHFSDSRSSVSSISPSSIATHSRLSSISTVNSTSHPYYCNNTPTEKTLDPEFPKIIEVGASESEREVVSSSPRATELNNNVDINAIFPRLSKLRPTLNISPTDSLATIAQIADNRLSEHLFGSPGAVPSVIPFHIRGIQYRSDSPSDAMLIKRPTLPPLRINTSSFTTSQNWSNQYLRGPLEYKSYFYPSAQHKRALSAPDFQAATVIALQKPISFSPALELTTPSSRHPDHSLSPLPSMSQQTPKTPPTGVASSGSQDIPCMYIPNCDTGSQRRKAISHIFGRNKLCTRLIPQRVWVHYCRKHYQRSRYRNPKEYSKLQCDLVHKQIERIADWAHNNDNFVVQDWSLSIRKREQDRLDTINNSTSRKRRAADMSGDEEDAAEGAQDFTPPTAVPQWLADKCGSGYSTAEIVDIFNRLHQAILDDELATFPDIEILPNILAEQDDVSSPRAYTKRKTSTPSHKLSTPNHKRSQSMVTPKSAIKSSPVGRRLHQPVDWSPSGSSVYKSAFSSQKRRRTAGALIFESPSPLSRTASLPGGRQGQHISRRSAINSIDERYGGEEESMMSGDIYGCPSSMQAPTPQRLNSQRSAVYLEANEHLTTSTRGPAVHDRSRSDVDAFTRDSDYQQSPYTMTHSSRRLSNPSFEPSHVQSSYQSR